jgi:RNA polymerase sigma-70 factor (ECF subfamily)
MATGERAEGASSDLVAAARRGESWALTQIWTTYAPAVAGYLRGRGASEPDDLTSDVFLAVFERISRFHGDANDLRAFVFTVAHHRLVDDLRRRSRRGTAVPYDAATDERLSSSAEEAALARVQTEGVREMLAQLSEDQREVLLLRVIGDLSLEQTADALGKRVGAVKALQHRALAALRRIMDQAVSL